MGRLVDVLGLAQPTVSKHLKVLREAELVTFRAEANRRLYRIRPEPLAEIDTWLRPYRELWADRLDRLEARLDHLAADGPTDSKESDHGS